MFGLNSNDNHSRSLSTNPNLPHNDHVPYATEHSLSTEKKQNILDNQHLVPSEKPSEDDAQQIETPKTTEVHYIFYFIEPVISALIIQNNS